MLRHHHRRGILSKTSLTGIVIPNEVRDLQFATSHRDIAKSTTLGKGTISTMPSKA
jgi:hypothetical protein